VAAQATAKPFGAVAPEGAQVQMQWRWSWAQPVAVWFHAGLELRSAQWQD
jgi:hypothetical protein